MGYVLANLGSWKGLGKDGVVYKCKGLAKGSHKRLSDHWYIDVSVIAGLYDMHGAPYLNWK
jgi:hypothetical protein